MANEIIERGYFNNGKAIPPDSILGITERYLKDPRPFKIDAGVGVFRIEKDITYKPTAVRIAAVGVNINYWPGGYLSPQGEREWAGEEAFLEGVARIVFGSKARELLDDYKLAAVGTTGGTGALAVYAGALVQRNPEDFVLISNPTWGPHTTIFPNRGLKTITYPHTKDNFFNLDAHLEAIKKSPPDTKILFHTGRTHNPTGTNPSTDGEWRILAQSLEGRRAIFDAAYAGFVDGLQEDTKPIRIFMEEGVSVAVAFSFSKNAGLYEQRVGALLIPLAELSREEVLDTQRLLNFSLRNLDSSPSAYGERIMSEVLSSGELMDEWKRNLAYAASTLKARRERLAKLVPQASYVKDQYGLFSLFPLTRDQVKILESDYAIYMTADGRVNIGGVVDSQIERLGNSIKEVISKG
ncbi:MAG: aminotransferase class I/II-fold pyridoxal phosphate-dependent enzyme [Candidatus Daviesbacteria bacterium]